MKKIINYLVFVFICCFCLNSKVYSAYGYNENLNGEPNSCTHINLYDEKENVCNIVNKDTTKVTSLNPYVKKSCQSAGTCVLLCKYQISPKKSDWSGSKFYYPNTAVIYYYPSLGGTDAPLFEVVWVSSKMYSAYTTQPSPIENLTLRFWEVHLENKAKESLVSGTCPSYAALDAGFWSSASSLCLENTTDWCYNSFNSIDGGDAYEKSKNNWPLVYDYYTKSGFEKTFDEYEVIYNKYKKKYEEAQTIANQVVEEAKKLEADDDPTALIEKMTFCKTGALLEKGPFNIVFNGKTISYQGHIDWQNPLDFFNHPMFTDYFKKYNNNKVAIFKIKNDMNKYNEYLNNISNLNSGLFSLCNDFDKELVRINNLTEEAAAKRAQERADKEADSKEILEKMSFVEFKSDIDLSKWDFGAIDTCTDILGLSTKELLDKVFNIIKYVVVILLVVLTSIDYFKGIISNDKDLIKKATKTAVMRLIIGLLIFFLPLLLDVLLKLFGFKSGVCGIGM